MTSPLASEHPQHVARLAHVAAMQAHDLAAKAAEKEDPESSDENGPAELAARAAVEATAVAAKATADTGKDYDVAEMASAEAADAEHHRGEEAAELHQKAAQAHRLAAEVHHQRLRSEVGIPHPRVHYAAVLSRDPDEQDPITDIDEAKRVCRELLGDETDVEEQDAQYGMWLVTLPRDLGQAFEEFGMLELHTENGTRFWMEMND